MFKELCKHDDLEGFNNLFAADGNMVYESLKQEWFCQGMQFYKSGKDESVCWNQYQRAGYKAYQVVKTAVAEMLVTR